MPNVPGLEFVTANMSPRLPPQQAQMVLSMVPDRKLLRRKDAAEKVRAIFFEHRASESPGEDEFWLAQSPFDKKWYLFASATCAGWPRGPVSTDAERPRWWDDR